MTTPTFCCVPDNDLYRAFLDGGGEARRVPDVAEAVERAEPQGTVLVLADGYPHRRTEMPVEVLELAAAKGLRMYVEFPHDLPAVSFGEPRTAQWERLVVTDETFGPALPAASLLSAHACVFLPTNHQRPLLVIARIAGYDRADFGVPASAYPALFELSGQPGVLVASTKLSGFRTGRYAPTARWTQLWSGILDRLLPDGPPTLTWTPVVSPTHQPHTQLEADAEGTAVERACQWHLASHVLLTKAGNQAVRTGLDQNAEAIPPDRLPLDAGDGSNGVLEGFESQIQPDGTQRCRLPLRADSTAETAMVLAVSQAGTAADNLLDYLFRSSGMCAGDRADADHPSYGLISWGVGHPDWEIANYGDDNARVLLGCLLASARRNPTRWTEPILKAVLANFRTTGRSGFRGDRIDMPELTSRGWRAYFDAALDNPSPHFEAYLWACYLWAYATTGYRPFLERTTTALASMMSTGPTGWRRNDTTERARMLLPLAWLVRVDDTPRHRGWLHEIATDLLRHQHPSGALPELEAGGLAIFKVPQTNEEYGVTESPIIQRTGDPASDQLYTTGFALLGLHEAIAATGDPTLREPTDRLADYLVRIQTRSDQPWLDGTWLRSFDFQRWDYWGSSGDLGWGAWCIELGWAPAWTTATLALRQSQSSLWAEASRVIPDKNLSRQLLRGMLAERLDEDFD
ncbi:hypothetical protein ABN034_12620 [Actinopolymorpha sp. B11F2]|uniref:hypothetical protein n=1 Tax=Actinopolymorpha sp. B11F2 TaxID=3160862 RepID=UPI0032E52A1E